MKADMNLKFWKTNIFINNNYLLVAYIVHLYHLKKTVMLVKYQFPSEIWGNWGLQGLNNLAKTTH